MRMRGLYSWYLVFIDANTLPIEENPTSLVHYK